jgi:hypothetical protein
MIGRFLKATLWLLVGHAALAGVYWGLLNVPESNVAMLGVSAVLVLLLVGGAAIVEGVGLRILAARAERWSAMRYLACVPAFIVAAALWLAISWAVGWVEARHTAHASEIDAWLIAHGDWTRTAWLHRTIEIVLWLLRYVVGLSLAVGVFVLCTVDGVGETLRPRRFVAGLGWKRLLIVAVAIVVFVWLPWRAAYWRPHSLPHNLAQPLFAAARLALIALVVHVGWAIVLWSAIPRATTAEPVAPGP